MKAQKINLDNVKNNWIYAYIASILDRDEILEDIERIRTDFELSPLISYDSLRPIDKPYSADNQPIDLIHYFKGRGNKAISLFLSFIPEKYIYFKNKYSLSDALSKVIKYAIFCGEVRDEDLDSTARWISAKEIEYINYKDEYFILRPFEAAIVINPETTKEGLLKLFHQYRGKVKKADHNRIRDIRKWYWLHKTGLGFNEIWIKANEVISEESIKREVRRYKSFLNGHPKLYLDVTSPTKT